MEYDVVLRWRRTPRASGGTPLPRAEVTCSVCHCCCCCWSKAPASFAQFFPSRLWFALAGHHELQDWHCNRNCSCTLHRFPHCRTGHCFLLDPVWRWTAAPEVTGFPREGAGRPVRFATPALGVTVSETSGMSGASAAKFDSNAAFAGSFSARPHGSYSICN